MPLSCPYVDSCNPQTCDKPVKDEEQLLRLVFSPIHFDRETGELKPEAIDVDDLSSGGVSVDRRALLTIAILNRTIKMFTKHDDKKFEGAALFISKNIRTIQFDDGNRCFKICPSPSQRSNRPSHADVLFTKEIDSYSKKIKYRNQLIDSIKDILPYDNCIV